MFERLDPHARHVFELAQGEARALGHRYVGTEHVLLALTLGGGPVADVLDGLGCGEHEVRAETIAIIEPGSRPAHPPETLLATLGIDLDAVRRRVESTFGADAVTRATLAVQPRRRWHGRSWWPNCTAGLPGRRRG